MVYGILWAMCNGFSGAHGSHKALCLHPVFLVFLVFPVTLPPPCALHNVLCQPVSGTETKWKYRYMPAGAACNAISPMGALCVTLMMAGPLAISNFTALPDWQTPACRIPFPWETM